MIKLKRLLQGTSYFYTKGDTVLGVFAEPSELDDQEYDIFIDVYNGDTINYTDCTTVSEVEKAGGLNQYMNKVYNI